MEAEHDSTARAMTVGEARGAGAYLAESDTYATLVAAATLAGPERASLLSVVTDRQFALAIGQFVLAAEYRAGLMRELADQLDAAADLARTSLMRRTDYAAVMCEADALPSEA